MPTEERLGVQDLIRREALAAGVPPELALAVAEQESSFNPTSIGQLPADAKGTRAIGTFQLLPETARMLQVDPNDPLQNIQGGVKYLRQLLDRHQGDNEKVLADYGGVKTNRTYVPQVLARVPKFIQGKPAADEPGWFNTLIQGMDPNEREGRQNLAGGIGSALGSIVGGTIGAGGGALASVPAGGVDAPVTVPAGALMGRRVGSAVGAGLFGGAEQLLLEETGLGDKLAEYLPGETNIAVPPPKPDSTIFGRTAQAGLEQGAYDVAGQAIMGAAKGVTKRALQGGVSKAATEWYAGEKQKAIALLQEGMDQLRTMTRDLSLARNRAGRVAGEAARAGTEEATLAAAARLQAERDAQAGHLRGARTAARTGVASAEEEVLKAQHAYEAWQQRAAELATGAQESGSEAVRAAQRAKAAGIGTARRAGTAAMEAERAAYQSGLGPPPSPSGAGRAVIDVFEGPATAARNAAGQAVDAAAASGPTRSIDALQAEARRIAEEELLPPASTFPSQNAAPPAAAGAAGAAGTATPPPVVTPLDQLVQDIGQAQYEELKRHPAMGVIARILRAPREVPFKDLHLWKSQLQNALKDTYDSTIKSQVESITQHLTGLMRETLAGHAPYDQATAAYGKIAPLFTKGFGESLRSIAVDSPEKIVHMITPDDPTSTKMLVEILTTQAEAGGGKEQGAKALASLQNAWVRRNLLEGDLGQLSERLASLRKRPEFVSALLGDERSKTILTNLDAIAAAFKQVQDQAAADLAASRATGTAGVEAAQAAKRGGVKQARAVGAEEVRRASARVDQAAAGTKAARTKGQETIEAARRAKDAALQRVKDEGKTTTRKVAAAGRTAKEAVRRTGEDARNVQAAKQQAARAGLRARAAGTPEEIAFEKSSLAPKATREPAQVLADLAHAAIRGPTSWWGGLGLARSLKGATDADIMLYAAHSPARTRAFIEALVHTPNRRGAAAVAGQVLKTTNVPPARARHREQRAQPPPAPPRR